MNKHKIEINLRYIGKDKIGKHINPMFLFGRIIASSMLETGVDLSFWGLLLSVLLFVLLLCVVAKSRFRAKRQILDV